MSTRANRRRRRRRSSLARQSCGLPLLWHAPPAVLTSPDASKAAAMGQGGTVGVAEPQA